MWTEGQEELSFTIISSTLIRVKNVNIGEYSLPYNKQDEENIFSTGN